MHLLLDIHSKKLNAHLFCIYYLNRCHVTVETPKFDTHIDMQQNKEEINDKFISAQMKKAKKKKIKTILLYGLTNTHLFILFSVFFFAPRSTPKN